MAGKINLLHLDLARAANDVFVSGKFLEGHGAAGVKLIGGDADLGAETELATIGETGGGVPVNGGGIDFAVRNSSAVASLVVTMQSE
jgi:hypothetical protein